MSGTRLVFYSACLGMLLFGMVMTTLGSVLPAITGKFGLTTIETGSLVSFLPFGILIGSFLFGPIVDRYGYKFLMISCVLLVLAGLEGIAFSENLGHLNISVFTIGLGGGVLNGATNALVADIHDSAKGASLSLLGVFYGLGTLGMPTVLNVLKGMFSTQQIISSVGIFVFIIAMIFMFIQFPEPKQAKGFPVASGIMLLKSPALLLAGFFLFFTSGSEGLINNWVTTYLQKVLQVDSGKALLALSVLTMTLTLSRLLLGKLLKVASSRILCFGFIGCEMIGALLLYLAPGYNIFLGGIVLLGLGMAAGFPIMLGYVAELFSDLSGTAFSVALVIALAGNMMINYTMGLISSTKGVGILPWLLMLCFAGMLIILQAFLFYTRGKLKLKP